MPWDALANSVVGAEPYLLVAGLAVLWPVAEILQTFEGDVIRALKTVWAALFIAVNVGFAVLIYALVSHVWMAQADPWRAALVTGLGWQALLRSRVHLLQPLTAEAGEAVSLSLADLYGRFQQFCQRQIDQALAMERIRLLEKAIELPEEVLERQLRLMAHASLLVPPDQVESYIKKLGGYDPEHRALLLASYLLRKGGYSFFKKRLREITSEARRAGAP